MTGGNLFGQIAIGGGDHAHIHRHLLLRTDRAHLALFQHAQQLGLQRQRQFRNFIEKQRAAAGVIKQALAARRGAGKSAFDMTEQFGLDQLFGDRRAVDGNERPLGAQAHAVQGACGELLAGARFAMDQHGRRRRRDALDAGADITDRGRVADHAFDTVVTLIQFATQHEVFPPQRRAFKTALHRIQHLRHRKRLEQKVRGPGAQRIDRGFKVGIGGHQHHVAAKTLVAQLMQPLDTRAAGQRNIEHDQIEVATVEQFGRFFHAAGGRHPAAAQRQRAMQKTHHARLVVDHQHRLMLPWRKLGGRARRNGIQMSPPR